MTIDFLLPSYALWMIGVIYGAFLLAGVVKGFLGMGLPAVLMSILTLIIPPIEAIVLVIFPMLVTNLFQYMRAEGRIELAKRYGVLGLVTFVVIIAVSANIESYPSALLLASLGVAMILFSLTYMVGFSFQLGASPLWQVLTGIMTGIIGGLSAVWSPPVVMYLLSRNVKKDEFIGAVGFLFLAGSIGLMLGLGSASLVSAPLALKSVIGLIIALIGFRIGEYFRGYIDSELFRKFVLIAFLVMGTRLLMVSLF